MEAATQRSQLSGEKAQRIVDAMRASRRAARRRRLDVRPRRARGRRLPRAVALLLRLQGAAARRGRQARHRAAARRAGRAAGRRVERRRTSSRCSARRWRRCCATTPSSSRCPSRSSRCRAATPRSRPSTPSWCAARASTSPRVLARQAGRGRPAPARRARGDRRDPLRPRRRPGAADAGRAGPRPPRDRGRGHPRGRGADRLARARARPGRLRRRLLARQRDARDRAVATRREPRRPCGAGSGWLST